MHSNAKWLLLFCLALPSFANSPFRSGVDPDEVIDSIANSGEPPASKRHLPRPEPEPERSERAVEPDDFRQGYTSTSFGVGEELAKGIAFLTDGRYWVVGKCFDNASFTDICLTRNNRDGSLDTSFGTTGKVHSSFGYLDELPHGIVLLTDGRAYVAGRASNGSNLDFALLRYNTNGTLDSSFGTVGMVKTAIGTSMDVARGIALDAQDRAVLAGYSYASTGKVLSAVVRYQTDGSLDTTFETDGVLTFSFGTNTSSLGSVVVASDGTIAVAGGNFGTAWLPVLARIRTNGTLDTAFNTSGKKNGVTTSPGFFYSVKMTPTGKISAAGTGRSILSGDICATLERFTTNGSSDSSFTDRTMSLGAGAIVAFYSQAILADNTTVGVGYYGTYLGTTAGNNSYSYRFLSNGYPDPNWTASYTASAGLSSLQDELFSVAQVNGKELVAVGRRSPNGSRFATVRLNAGTSGGQFAPDYSFGSNGQVTLTGVGVAYKTLIDTLGNAVVLGYPSSGTYNMTVFRFNRTTYALDTAFNTIGRSIATYGEFYTGVIQDDGKIVALGRYSGAEGVVLSRFNSNGTLDTTFRNTGYVRQSFNTMPYYFVNDVLLRSNQKLVTVGYLMRPSGADHAGMVASYNTNGTFDTSFATVGYRLVSGLPLGDQIGFLKAAGMDSAGRINLGGATGYGYFSATYPAYQFAGRILTDGSFDTAFNTVGYVEFAVSAYSNYSYEALLHTDGRIVLAGWTMLDWNYDLPPTVLLTRWNTNGTLDTSFATGGFYLASFAGSSFASVMSVDTSGRYYVGGSANTTGGFYARFLSDGFLDTGFATNGFFNTNVAPYYETGIFFDLDGDLYTGSLRRRLK